VESGSNSRFVGWVGGCAGTAATCTVLVYRDRYVGAAFTPTRLVYDTSSGGHIQLTPAGSSCSAPKLLCNEFAYNTYVVAQAVPDSGFAVGKWLEDCAFAAPTHRCGLYMNRDHLIRARFDQVDGDMRQGQMGQLNQIVAIKIFVYGNGTVTTGSTSCIQSSIQPCVRKKARGQTASLVAAPATGYRLIGWGGRCAGTAPACTVAYVKGLRGDPRVSATFGR
jgi:Divergent InlB B-repeat domain